MRRLLPILVVLAVAGPAQARGLLIPTEKKVPPLAMLNHHVTVAVEDQVAITRVEQTFRNHTDRQLEATYVFPVSKGASVREFAMWIGDTKVPGELVEADKARQIYTSIVQRTQDPGLLEYLGNNLLRLRVFPVPPRGDQKITLSYTSVAPSENGVIEYVYPLRTDGKAVQTLEKFSLRVDLRSQHALTNIYSPTHAIAMTRPSDRQAVVTFAKEQALLDRDFQLYYKAGTKDVGLTALAHRPIGDVPGYFLLLISPRAELSKSQQVPRDMVFVLDTSGSMRGKRMDQARNALTYCLNNLGENDRFALLNFATTVNKYHDGLQPATKVNVAQARKWVSGLEASGGTAINDALVAALAMRGADTSRTFTIVFFTDGRPTIGETDVQKIQRNVLGKNTANTRIFSFGVGDDVNATFLDKLAEESRALSTYVRESEDIEHRVSTLYSKISNPVLANLKLTVNPNVKLAEVYPPELPDLFHGSQLVVLGRYTGQGHVAVKLTGSVGKDAKEFVYEVNFPDRTNEARTFVEDLWARRKVGYLLDQIRVNGENKELVTEVVTLAKRYGITTPYTSYLVVPDAPVPVARFPRPEGKPDVRFHVPAAAVPPALQRQKGTAGAPARTTTVTDFVKGKKGDDKLGGASGTGLFGGGYSPGFGGYGGLGGFRGAFEASKYKEAAGKEAPSDLGDKAERDRKERKALISAFDQMKTFEQARELLGKKDLDAVQAGRLGVDLSVQTNALRTQARLTQSATRNIQNRSVLEVGGVWIDEGFDPKMKTVAVKAMSKAYFRILERHPSIRQVFQLGNYLVWVTPSRTALVIDSNDGVEQLSDADIDRLFAAPPAKEESKKS
ncbi:MAG: VWA domain-containing protein [Gemmataceae bacterium]|nr:VWA domain-containing protein [Gemmataceae bacterium]